MNANDDFVKKHLYPKYELPSEEEWIKIAGVTNTPEYFPNGIQKSPKEIKKSFKKKKFLFNTKETYTNSLEANAVTFPSRYFKPNKLKIYHTIGNVSEMTKEKGIAKGGSWKDPLKDCTIQNAFEYSGPESWVGFRAVCQWVENK